MMKIAFKRHPVTIPAKAICWWTESEYFHSELVFSCGLSFSSDLDTGRTRFKTIDYLHTSDWITIVLPFDAKTEEEIFKFCCEEEGCRYDWVGIFLTQIIPLSRQSKSKWFCSEVCTRALQIGGWLEDVKPHEISPGELINLIIERRLLNQIS